MLAVKRLIYLTKCCWLNVQIKLTGCAFRVTVSHVSFIGWLDKDSFVGLVSIICAFTHGLMELCPPPVAVNASVGVNSSMEVS